MFKVDDEIGNKGQIGRLEMEFGNGDGVGGRNGGMEGWRDYRGEWGVGSMRGVNRWEGEESR